MIIKVLCLLPKLWRFLGLGLFLGEWWRYLFERGFFVCSRLQDLVLLLLVITLHPHGSPSLLCILDRNFCAKMYDYFFLKLLALVYLVDLKALAMLKLTGTSLVFYQLFTGWLRVLLLFMFYDSNYLFEKVLSVITSTAGEFRMQVFLEPEKL